MFSLWFLPIYCDSSLRQFPASACTNHWKDRKLHLQPCQIINHVADLFVVKCQWLIAELKDDMVRHCGRQIIILAS
jgi:hypothetical protein